MIYVLCLGVQKEPEVIRLNQVLFSCSRYSLQNCLFAATYDKILEECQCVPYFHTAAFKEYPIICAGEGLFCMNNVLRDIGSHTNISSYETNGGASKSGNSSEDGKNMFHFQKTNVQHESNILQIQDKPYWKRTF